jgi:hypothetical protein
VKSADHRVELRDTRYCHRLLDGVNQSHVTARADHDQPAALHDVAGGVLVRMGVFQQLAAVSVKWSYS